MNSPGSSAERPPGLSVGEAGERAIIGRIRSRIPRAPAALVVGIGDDAAVATPDRGALQVLTTDSLVEGVHFDRRFSSPSDIGFKALAVNVSDVAAMGGSSRYALLSLMLPGPTTLADVDGLLDGLLEMAAAARVTLAGGNITRSPGPLVVDVALVGSVRPRKVLTRGGARAGDTLYVTGAIGAGAAGLAWLRESGGTGLPQDADLAACVARYRRPEPRARIGAILGRTRAATACMDTSDGLADAVTQICEASGVGALLDPAALPVHPGARQVFPDPVTAALAGGDDYELVFSVSRKARGRLRAALREARGVPMTRIGELTADKAIGLRSEAGIIPLPQGFAHF